MNSFLVFDLETTGVEPTDKVVELGWCPMTQDGEAKVKIKQAHSHLCNPGIPIPPETSAIHHITDFTMKSIQATFEERIELVMATYGPTTGQKRWHPVAHNAKFEQQFITPSMVHERQWVCTYKCAMRAWPDAPSHSNQVLRYWLPELNDQLFYNFAMPPHRAAPDAYVTSHILARLLKKHPLAELLEWSSEVAMPPRINFGMHKGKKWVDAPIDYLEWLIFTSDFDADMKTYAKAIMEERRHGNV